MATKPAFPLTCSSRVTIFLFSLSLTLLSTLAGTSPQNHETTAFHDVARKLKLDDNELLKTEKRFKIFMESYGKRYATREEYLHRLGIFAGNMAKAAEHQVLDPTAIHGVTQFSDLSEEEFERFYTGVKGGFPASNAAGGVAPPLEVEGLPENFDWREKGAVTEVKMQASVYA